MGYSKFVEVVDVGEAKDDGCQEYDRSIRCLRKEKKGNRSRTEENFFRYWTLYRNVREISFAKDGECSLPQCFSSLSNH